MLARKSFLQFLGNSFISLVGMVSTIVIGRTLGPTALGEIGYALGVAGLFFLFADMGFHQTHLKRVSEGQNLGRANGTFLTVKSILLSLSILACGVYLLLASIFHWPVWIDTTTRTIFLFIFASLFFDHIANAMILTFQARQEVLRFNVPQILSQLAKLLVIVLSVSLVDVASAYFIQSLIFFAAVVFLFRTYPLKRLERSMLQKYFVYATPFFTMIPISLLADNLDKVLLKILASVEQVGYYTAVQGFTLIIPLIISKPVMHVFFPHISRLHTKSDVKTIQESTDLIVRYLSILTIPLLVLIAIFRRDIITMLYGPSFLPAAPVLLVATFTAYAITIIRPYLNVLYGMERHRYFPHVSFALLLVTIVLYMFLVPHSFYTLPTLGLGAVGIALATLIIWIMDGFIKVLMLRTYEHFRFYSRIVLHIASGFGLYGFIIFSERFFGHHFFNPFIVVSLLLYFVFLVACRELKKADLGFMRQVMSPRALLSDISQEMSNNKKL